jgi:hypothetical protein
MTRVVDGDLLKVMTWYDNEWGFTNQMIRQQYKLASLQDKFRLLFSFLLNKYKKNSFSIRKLEGKM